MPDLTEVYAALQKADAAGDAAGAKQLADYIRAQPATPAASSPTREPFGVADYAAAVPETALQVGSGLIATPASGILGLGTMAGRALGLTLADPADVVRGTQSALTYQPRTQGGQAVSGIVSYLPQKLASAADTAGGAVTDFTGSPSLGALANTGIQALPLIAGGLGARFLPTRTPATVPSMSPEVMSAIKAGFKLTPEQGSAGVIGRATQSLTGSAKLERSLSKANAPTVNDLGAQEIGLPPESALTPATIAAAKTPHNAIYDQVSKLGDVTTDQKYQSDIAGIANRTGAGSFGFDVPPSIERLRQGYADVQNFDAADAVQKIRQLRADSSKNIKAPNSPEQNALGYSQRQIATAIENQLDRHIQTLHGQVPEDLIGQFRSARQQLAKINTIEESMEGPNLSPRLLNKQPYLSGNLKTISDAYENFDRALQDPTRIRDSGPFGVLDLGFGVAGGLSHPGLAAAVLARPLARGFLGSDIYQNTAIAGKPLLPPTRPALKSAARVLPIESEQQRYGLPTPVPYLMR